MPRGAGGYTLTAGRLPYRPGDLVKRQPHATRRLPFMQLLCAVGLWWTSAEGAEGPYRLTLIDVGYGLSVIVQDPRGTALLVDGGYAEEATVVMDALAHAGIDSLAVAVASHGHGDHLEGLVALLRERFPIGQVLGNVPKGHASFDSSFWIALGELPYAQMQAGDRAAVGGVGIHVLYPDALTEDLNESSLVLRLTLAAYRVMLPADIGVRGQERLVSAAGDSLASDVLVAPHHGDVIATSFLQKVDPAWIMVSVGPNPWELPAPSTMGLAAQRRLYDTRRDGTVVLTFDGEGISVESRRPRDLTERREAEMASRLERWRHAR